MEVVKNTSPYMRKDVSTKRMMTDVLIALIPVVLFAIYRFGSDAIIRIIVSLVVMIGLEAIAFGMMNRPKNNLEGFKKFLSRYDKYTINNVVAPAVSGLIFALLIPSQLPIYAVVMGAAFGILVGKMVFGGLGSNIFNAAAVGFIFINLALTNMFTDVYVGSDLIAGGTPLAAIKLGASFPYSLNSYPIVNLFLGTIPGGMGEVSALAILVGMVYLLVRKSADFRLITSFIVTFVVLIFVAGLKLYPEQALDFTLYHLFSGGILFGAVFMITDPVTVPGTRPGRWLFGILVGSVVVLIRLFGAYNEGVAFAIIFGNMFAPLFDYPQWATNKYKPSFFIGAVASLIVMALIVYFGVGGVQ